MQKILCLMGQTATGKTEISTKLSRQFPFKIISVDSSMLYKHMNIGTAKPPKSLLEFSPHRLINILEPESYYSIGNFVQNANEEISNILKFGNIPLLTGGTMMYFHALQYGVDFQNSINKKASRTIRNTFHKKLLKYERSFLDNIDKRTRGGINLNSRYTQKSIEFYSSTGKSLTESHIYSSLFRSNRKYRFINIGVKHTNYNMLHEKIKDRLSLMLHEGLVDEVRSLKSRIGLTNKKPSVNAIAYKQVWDYLDNKYDFDTMKREIEKATINLARQQEKWMSRFSNIRYFLGGDPNLYEKISIEVKNIFV